MTSHVKFDERMGSCHYRTRQVDHKKKSPRAKLDDCIRLFGSRNVVPLVKYVKKQVSGIFEHHAKNFSAYENGNVVLEQRWNEPFENYSKPIRLSTVPQSVKSSCGTLFT
jgi:hypothetical protein